MSLNAMDVFTFHKDAKSDVELTGFWPPEEGFVWSTGRWCEISFALQSLRGRKSLNFQIELDLDVFKLPPDLEGQNILIYVNGLRLASRFITTREVILLDVAAAVIRPTENIITIDTPDGTKPSVFGLLDSRRLSVQLFSIRIRET